MLDDLQITRELPLFDFVSLLGSQRRLVTLPSRPTSNIRRKSLPGEEKRSGRTRLSGATSTRPETFISEFTRCALQPQVVVSTSTIANALVSKQECQHTGSGIPSEHRVFECSMIPTVNVLDISVPQAYQLGVRVLASDTGIPAL
ncbi:hypothetical protein PQX77_020831 [Marasmius sp. AFHP31]|nr:hypothetical protein PQX77_020831 [Marasmius sp. AFHP31]